MVGHSNNIYKMILSLFILHGTLGVSIRNMQRTTNDGKRMLKNQSIKNQIS